MVKDSAYTHTMFFVRMASAAAAQTVATITETHEGRVPLSEHRFAALSIAQLTSETGMRTAYSPGLSHMFGKPLGASGGFSKSAMKGYIYISGQFDD